MSQVSYQKLFSLAGKNAIVTGGAGMLGRQFCHGLAEMGANVAVVDINRKGAETLALELGRTYPVKAISAVCDVSNPLSVRRMVKTVAASLGGIHILHNNHQSATKLAGLDAHLQKFEKYTLKEWRRVLAVDLDGMFLVAQAVGNQMIRQKSGGSIIQTASIYGIMAPDHRIYKGSFYRGRQIGCPAVYATGKGGVVALTRYLATYWADHGIRVNSMTPGGVESGQNDEFKRRYSNRIPLGRMAKSHEMVGALLYLASDASSYVTGHNLVIDGGLNAW